MGKTLNFIKIVEKFTETKNYEIVLIHYIYFLVHRIVLIEPIKENICNNKRLDQYLYTQKL